MERMLPNIIFVGFYFMQESEDFTHFGSDPILAARIIHFGHSMEKIFH